MAYITQTELGNRFALLKWWTDDDASGAIDSTIVSEAIALAAAEIDAAAGQHYSVPLGLGDATTAAIIKDKAGTVAGYKLAQRRREADVPETLRQDYEDVLKWLAQLAAGKVYLKGETAVEADRPGGGLIIDGGAAKITRTEMEGL